MRSQTFLVLSLALAIASVQAFLPICPLGQSSALFISHNLPPLHRPTLKEIGQGNCDYDHIDECFRFNNKVEDSDNTMMEDVLAIISKYYDYHEVKFRNGDVLNQAGQNGGTAKLLSYAALYKLDKPTTLKLWGQHYRDVLADPKGDSHQNIRNFMVHGWEGIDFWDGIALMLKDEHRAL
eukprot:Nitzschia sp. Nitz4//scaffold17_size182527//130523//131150//NITZ4_001871-RA/size182527-snap-gene-0.300-mRNA-1//-1//CDS//3329539391//5175//frame0